MYLMQDTDSKHCKILDGLTFDIDRMLQDFNQVANDIKYETNVYDHGFLSINRQPGSTRPIHIGDKAAAHYFLDQNYQEQKADGVSLEQDAEYTDIYDEFKGTYTHDVLLELQGKFRLGRVRYAIRGPRSCLSWHKDLGNRLHIPITTNPGCKMCIDREIFHMPADGRCYWTETSKFHNFFNGGKTQRIHFIAVLLNE